MNREAQYHLFQPLFNEASLIWSSPGILTFINVISVYTPKATYNIKVNNLQQAVTTLGSIEIISARF